MLRQVRAAYPRLNYLANLSKQASFEVEHSNTALTKKAQLINLDGINIRLVDESIKLGSSVMQSLEKTKKLEDLEDLSKSKKLKNKEASVPKGQMLKALGIGAGLTAVPFAAANYTLDKASDDLDAKLFAIPGIAAATVGAILAARTGSGKKVESPDLEKAKELHNAISAKEVLDNANALEKDPEVLEDLQKMSSISTDHIASLLVDLLT